jgi:hypothetical protein
MPLPEQAESMRNYWLRIVLGAVAIFTVGMIGVTLARQGVGRVRNVVEGSGPLSVPVPFIPFKLDGQKLGTVSKIVLQRNAPKHISSVELQIKLEDSAIAQGLSGCRLAANFDEKHSPHDVHVGVGPMSHGVFTCVHQNDSTGQFQEFGQAIFQPGDVSVPLLLPNDIVTDLQQGNFGDDHDDSISDAQEAKADSAAEAQERLADSLAAQGERAAKEMAARQRQFLDSLRREGRDSMAVQAQRAANQMTARQRQFLDSLRREGVRRADSARHSVRNTHDRAPRQ